MWKKALKAFRRYNDLTNGKGDLFSSRANMICLNSTLRLRKTLFPTTKKQKTTFLRCFFAVFKHVFAKRFAEITSLQVDTSSSDLRRFCVVELHTPRIPFWGFRYVDIHPKKDPVKYLAGINVQFRVIVDFVVRIISAGSNFWLQKFGRNASYNDILQIGVPGFHPQSTCRSW